MIYLFAPEDDSHTIELIRTRSLAARETQHLTADLFVNNGVSISSGRVSINGQNLSKSDVLVYRRRLNFYQSLEKRGYSNAEKVYLARILNEHADAFLLACETICRVVNPKSQHCLALSKPQQLHAARHFGLKIPSTLFSNDTDNIQVWLEDCGRTVIKPYSAGFELNGGRSGCVQAVEVERRELENFSFSESPMIIQQLIESDDEIRVLVRLGSLMCFSLGWSNLVNGVDWRPHQNSLEVTPFYLPSDIESKLLQLCQFLGIEIGTVDLIRCGQEFYFLEANLAGNYQMPCSLPICPAEWVAEGLSALVGSEP